MHGLESVRSELLCFELGFQAYYKWLNRQF